MNRPILGNKTKTKTAIIKIENLTRRFDVGENRIDGLNGVSLNIDSSDFCLIFGQSGCGKSTLLNIISGIDVPTSGRVIVRGVDIFKLNEDERADFRSKKMGIVHQMPYWIKSLKVLDNVAMPLIIEGEAPANARKKAFEVLSEIGIESMSHQYPTQLSGGQQQRVGIARALISNPWILLADEPTGNLDSTNSDNIVSLFHDLNVHHKRTIVMVTHNQAYWTLGTRRIEMKDGKIIKEVHHG